ncbi:MAG: ABC transporter ATP-binding protein, partial [Muribaculaceae bacterium]|nr:ABC transporter ATP-binding protein [Muribaculaceae bacterium]
ANNMFGLLNRLRRTSGVRNCYTFGATLHVVADTSFDPDQVSAQLTADGLKNVKIYRTKGDIEDLFIKLTRDE